MSEWLQGPLSESCAHTRQGQKSIWVAKSRPRWSSFVESATGLNLIVQSSHGNIKGGESGSHWVNRCLPGARIATLGLLILCCRWAYAGRAVGGL